jgi:branched-subunit amino acid ABC-type transport system permease component
MVRIVALAALVAAGGVAVRWWLTRQDTLGRARPFPLLSVIVLLAVAGTAGAVVIRHERLEARLSEAASALIGTSAKVECQTVGASMVDAGGDLGFVRWGPDGVPERRTLIKRDVCSDLRAYLSEPDGSIPMEQVIAVHVLTHEAMHMAGERSEALTECRAVQRNAAMARLLGASAGSAAALSARYWSEVYPRQTDPYRTRDCAPGGPLDEGGSDAPWNNA